MNTLNEEEIRAFECHSIHRRIYLVNWKPMLIGFSSHPSSTEVNQPFFFFLEKSTWNQLLNTHRPTNCQAKKYWIPTTMVSESYQYRYNNHRTRPESWILCYILNNIQFRKQNLLGKGKYKLQTTEDHIDRGGCCNCNNIAELEQ